MLSDEEIMQQVLAAFQEEQAEHRQAIGTILLELERNPQHPQHESLVVQLFREAHSLKGGARAAGIESAEQIAHVVEDLFSAVKKGTLLITPDVCDPVYAAMEAIGALMAEIAAGREARIEPYEALLADLARLLAVDAVDAAVPPPQPAPAESVPDTASRVAPGTTEPPTATESKPDRPPSTQPAGQENPSSIARFSTGEEVPWEAASATVRLSTATLDSLMNETGELITNAVRAQQRSHDARALANIPVRWRRIWRQTHPIISRLQQQQPELQPTVHHLHDREERIGLASEHTTSISLLQYDTVMLLDALLLANRLLSDLEQRLMTHARDAAEDAARLSAVTNRLQEQIRRTRMLPLSTLLSPLRVQIREMVRTAGKQIALETDDGGAEADRQVLESLREVLLHLIRNAIDHGIEPAEVRAARGKPAIGRLTLRALVSGDYLDLSVEDDGAGLDIELIRQRAMTDGVVNDGDLARMNESDLTDLIFLPGFSTRQTVDKLSGRGVGLDVVRSQVERMHGQVTVHSIAGEGTVFTIRVPLSLTSSHGLLLQIGEGTYMLPLESIQRIVQIAAQDIQIVEGQSALKLDGHPITLIHLADLLGETRRSLNGVQSSLSSGRSLAVLLGSGERRVACVIDAVLGEQELVVHRLPAPLQRVRFIAGATILADGKVVPILDLVDLLRAAMGTRGMVHVTPEAISNHIPTIVVVDDSITTRTLEKNILEAAGYHVHLATDGIEALQVLQHLVENGGCDLLLSDIDMPNLNGFDLTAQVRADPTLKHLPIVLVTSLDTPADRERGLSAGADAYIVKRTFDQQTLLDTIAHLL